MELALELQKNNSLDNSLAIEQNKFLESTLGKVINTGIDMGLRYLLPDFIENQVIDIKNTLFNDGFKEAMNKTINSAVNMGKSVLGIFTGNFESISQAHSVIEKGGLLDSVSKAIDSFLNKAVKDKTLPKDITSIIKDGKNNLLKDIKKGIDKTFSDQLKAVERIDKYCQNWQKFYEKKDFNNMQKEMTKIKRDMKTVLPLENTINKMREVENLHNLIKNKGGDFNISKEELELSKKLI